MYDVLIFIRFYFINFNVPSLRITYNQTLKDT